ncbi:MAG: UDP-N-acetylmuramate--L-alanine ligase [Bacteroidota bacterium]
MNLGAVNSIYFLGIGGIGMSALARYFHLTGREVKGYDRVESMVSKGLEEMGMEIFYMLNADHVAGADLMVYTPAISKECVEYVAAERLGIPIMKRSEVLGVISESYRTLAVAGTHGKTTTSSMLTHVLASAGVQPTAFLGGISRNLNANFTFGMSDWMVAEADEYDRSFLTLHPYYAIITSLDPDHLDIYGTEEEMQQNFRAFANQSRKLLVEAGLKGFDWGKNTKVFGIESGDFRAENLRFQKLETLFDFRWDGGKLDNLRLGMPGRHNVLNMTAALGLAIETGVQPDQLPEAVDSFQGIYRRFEVHLHQQDLSFIDDYAHHPEEIAAAMSTARALFPERQLLVVFQPHLFSRTRDLCEGFAAELSKADRTLLMEIYPAREEPIPGITSESILTRMTLKRATLVSRDSLISAIQQELEGPTVLLTLGAGDIDKEVPKIANALIQ